MRQIRRALAVLLVATFSASCVGPLAPPSTVLSRLSNRGPVAITQNPYVVGNLELAREVARSPVLDGFITHRGTPSAIEVRKQSFGSYQLILYYLAQQEQFRFGEVSSEWIIEGPQSISAETIALVASVAQPGLGHAPLLSREALKAVTGEEIAAPAPTTSALTAGPVVSQEIHGANQPGTSSGPRESSAANNSLAAPSQTGTPPASDQEIAAQLQAKGAHPAEITAKGDLVHYVTLPGETLPIISRWYTFDRSNAGRLARINGIKDPGTISVGDIVIVPAYLVRNKNRLSQEAVDRLSASSALSQQR